MTLKGNRIVQDNKNWKGVRGVERKKIAWGNR